MTIREFRKHLNLSQYEFGKLVGVTSSCVSGWEYHNKQPKDASVIKLLDLAKTHNISLEIDLNYNYNDALSEIFIKNLIAQTKQDTIAEIRNCLQDKPFYNEIDIILKKIE